MGNQGGIIFDRMKVRISVTGITGNVGSTFVTIPSLATSSTCFIARLIFIITRIKIKINGF